MPLTDLPLEDLRDYHSTVTEPPDFEEFWRRSLGEARDAPGAARIEGVSTPITALRLDDLVFPGFGGEDVRAWVARPRTRDGEKLPVVVEFNGYNGGRGLAGERVNWALAGYVHVFMDTRGQGSGWGTGGDTPDPHGSGPAAPGFLTRGILDAQEYYYRRVFTDAVRLVDAVRTLPFVDEHRVAVTGGSQGGGITLAVAALTDVQAAMPDVAFLCDFRHASEVALGDPYQEIARYLSVHRDQVDDVFATTAYFDGVNFARHITAPALFSVALMDETVPPSTVFAAFNATASADKDIVVYPFNGHEGGQGVQWHRQAEWLSRRMPAPRP
jgi:cephalosporin-C deacetylase